MMHQWTVLCFILATCAAQQHLTCFRTDETITPSPQTTDGNVQQGLQRLKGEPGIPDNSVIDEFKEKKSVDSASTLMQICRSKRG